MVNDDIKTYIMGAAAGVRQFCSTCARQRAVWVAETQGGDTIICCSFCQRVLSRVKTASIPPLSVN